MWCPHFSSDPGRTPTESSPRFQGELRVPVLLGSEENSGRWFFFATPHRLRADFSSLKMTLAFPTLGPSRRVPAGFSWPCPSSPPRVQRSQKQPCLSGRLVVSSDCKLCFVVCH